jgi:hypothetical protein
MSPYFSVPKRLELTDLAFCEMMSCEKCAHAARRKSLCGAKTATSRIFAAI